MKRGMVAGASVGAIAAAAALALPLLGGPSVPDLAIDALTLALPGSVFGYLLDRLQDLGRPLVLASVALVFVGGGALIGLLLARRARTGPAARRAPGQLGRRRFLYAAGALSAGWVVLFLGGRFAGALERAGSRAASSGGIIPARADATPPPDVSLTGLTPAKDFYVVSKNGIEDPAVKASEWRLRIGGTTPYELSYEALLALPAITLPRTLECISNLVGGDLISTAEFTGVRLGDLLARAGIPARAAEIRFACADGYTESLPLAVARDPSTLVAYRLGGERLAVDHGFPARIVLSGRYGMKQPKWLTQITPGEEPYDGYWEQRGWSKDAFVLTFSRIDAPNSEATVPVGRALTLRGVAFAGARGISRVEWTADGGASWREATLSRVLPKDAWMPWTASWTPSASGVHDLRVRATDGEGTPQDPTENESFPDGATGIHRISVKAV